MIRVRTLDFLADLRENNNRDWLDAHKGDYLAAQENVKALADAVTAGLNQTDEIAKCYVYRIYRDLRFTKDKTPYKDHFEAYLYRAGAHRRGGYVFRIGPGASQVGGGFFGPNKEDLLRIR